jgi:hydrogenase nickel incorporation protein HypA/HybF
MSIAMSIVDIARETAEKNRAKVINRIEVEIGALAGVVPEALTFGFEAVTKNTPAENAELVVRYVPAEAVCESCGFRFETKELIPQCPECGEMVFTVSGGRELRVTSINVD